MSARSLRERVQALEAVVARLRILVEGESKRPAVPWWDKIAGTLANDPIYQEAAKLGREWRTSQRPRSRKQRKN